MEDHEREFLSLLGYLYLRHGRLEEARVLFEALEVLLPDDLSIRKTLSYIYLRAGEYPESLEETERFMQKATEREDREMGHLLRSKAYWGLGDKAAAAASYEEALNLKEARPSP